MDLNERIKDFDERIKLSLQKGGLGNATFDYNESPTTQTHTQAAASGLNSGYNQMLADIHRFGDIQRADYNMKLKGLNAGLENQYKEELKEKEFNNDLKKLKFIDDLNVARERRNREQQLADREWAINNQKELQEEEYRRNLPYFMENGREKPINRQNILQDPNTGKKFLYKSNTFPVVELPDELQNLYYNYSKELGKTNVSEYDILTTNDFKNYLVRNFNTRNDSNKLVSYLKAIDAAENKYRKNLPERPYIQYEPYGADIYNEARNLNSRNNNDPDVKYLGGGVDGNPMSSFMFGLFKTGNLPAQNFIKQNGLMIAGYNQKESVDASELADIINTTPPKVLNELYGFVNNHGMDDKVILTNPNNPQKYYIYEKSSNNVYSFYISHYTEDGKPYFEPLGPVGFQSLDKDKNNYEDKGLLYNLENFVDDGMYNLGRYINKTFTEGDKRAEPNPNNALVRVKGNEYKLNDLFNIVKDKINSE